MPGAAALPPEGVAWVEAAFARELATLTFSEISRSLASLTQDYVQRRARLAGRAALAGRGKRAAFALYYAPRHYAVVRHALLQLGLEACQVPLIVDLGCGSAVAGAAWSGLYVPRPAVLGVDPAAWALVEAQATCSALAVPLRTVRATASRLRWPRGPLGVVAGWMVNELEEAPRAALLAVLARRAASGDALLVVEPLATRITPWWPEWSAHFAAWGGRADVWRCTAELPAPVVELGRAARLDPRELGGRTLWLPPRGTGPRAAQEPVRSAS